MAQKRIVDISRFTIHRGSLEIIGLKTHSILGRIINMREFPFPAWLIIFILCFCIILFGFGIYFALNLPQLEVWSYAVDPNGDVYIARVNNIVIISNRETRSIPSPVDRYYVIGFEKDLVVVYSSAEKIFYLDKDGTVINTVDDKGDRIFTEMDLKSKRTYIINDIGYSWRRVLSMNYIVRTAEGKSSIIYHDSFRIFIAQTLCSILVAIFFIVIALYVIRTKMKAAAHERRPVDNNLLA